MQVNVIQGDLLNGIKQNNLIDLFVFNPPYVPSEKEEEKEIIDKAWAGGADGRITIDRYSIFLFYFVIQY